MSGSPRTRSSRISQTAGSSASRLPGPGDYRRQHPSSARISVSSGPVKECTGLMSTRTSVSKVCFMVSRRSARDRSQPALEPVPCATTDRRTRESSRRAVSPVLKPGVAARAADAQRYLAFTRPHARSDHDRARLCDRRRKRRSRAWQVARWVAIRAATPSTRLYASWRRKTLLKGRRYRLMTRNSPSRKAGSGRVGGSREG
jgi:hypothetical protein